MGELQEIQAEASKQQAKASTRMVCVTYALLSVAVVSAVVSYWQYQVADKSASAAKQAADTAEKALVISQRPWLTFDTSIAGPLTFDDHGATLPLDVTLKNISEFPATAVDFEAKLLPVDRSQNDIRERDALCNGLAARRANPGDTLFKNESRVIPYAATAGQRELDTSSRAFGEMLVIYVIGCVSYRSTISDETKWTGHSFRLVRSADGGRSQLAITMRMPVPREQLLLLLNSLSAKVAK